MKRLMAQIGNKHPSTGGLSRSFSLLYERELKSWPNKNPLQVAADFSLVLSLENVKKSPEARTLKKALFSDHNAKLQRSLVGLEHGPMLPEFENSPGLTTLGALALQGKRACQLFSDNPNGKHGRAFISPLCFWIGSDPLGHSWLPADLLENQKFTKHHKSLAPHAKSLSQSIRDGDRFRWFNDKWKKRDTYSDYYDTQVQNNRVK